MNRIYRFLFPTLLTFNLLFGNTAKQVYQQLDPLSLPQLLAFLQLYPQSEEADKVMVKLSDLLGVSQEAIQELPSDVFQQELADIVYGALLRFQSPKLSPSSQLIDWVAKYCGQLSNRSLKGYGISSEKELLELDESEWDLSRAVLLSTLGEKHIDRIRTYEANLDLMALQVKARIGSNATNEDKVHALNALIFDELRFRFPPHTLSEEKISEYSFLNSVMDAKKGVCLGVSILYLSLAQRLDLPLEAIAPPGHIYVRYRTEEKTINIETTARGLNLPDEAYLGINTRLLKKRSLRDVVSMQHFNAGSGYWREENYTQAIESYKTALKYSPNDPLVREFLAYCYLWNGEEELGRKMCAELSGHHAEDTVSGQDILEDFNQGKTSAEALRILFQDCKQQSSALQARNKELKQVLEKWPEFRSAWLHLAINYLQMRRNKEALATLKKYHELDSQHPLVEYYLTILCAERYECPEAWIHLEQAIKICHQAKHHPEVLKQVLKELFHYSPNFELYKELQPLAEGIYEENKVAI
ncbi:MAG: hypothetical protein CMO81_05960 [Waddliaceae bacterium]|nr:hypothetical protein [Waddliaceae bacterium]